MWRRSSPWQWHSSRSIGSPPFLHGCNYSCISWSICYTGDCRRKKGRNRWGLGWGWRNIPLLRRERHDESLSKHILDSKRPYASSSPRCRWICATDEECLLRNKYQILLVAHDQFSSPTQLYGKTWTTQQAFYRSPRSCGEIPRWEKSELRIIRSSRSIALLFVYIWTILWCTRKLLVFVNLFYLIVRQERCGPEIALWWIGHCMRLLASSEKGARSWGCWTPCV